MVLLAFQEEKAAGLVNHTSLSSKMDAFAARLSISSGCFSSLLHLHHLSLSPCLCLACSTCPHVSSVSGTTHFQVDIRTN